MRLIGKVAGLGAGLGIAVILTGCAGSSQPSLFAVEEEKGNKVAQFLPQNMSPILYETYDCDQIRKEADVLTKKAEALSGVAAPQKASVTSTATKAASKNSKQVIIWPTALETTDTKNQTSELLNLKERFLALEKAAEREKCSFKFRRNEPKTNAPQTNEKKVEKAA